MANVLIRNLSDDVLDRYRERAGRLGVPVNSVLREALEREVGDASPHEALAAFDAFRARTRDVGPSAVELIRMDRDSR